MRGHARVLPAAALLLISMLCAASPAGAATVDTRVLSSTFDGTGSVPHGAFAGVGRVAVHEASESVYVIDRGHEAVARFNLAGVPKEFTSPSLPAGSTSLTGSNTPDGSLAIGGSEADIAVDNSGGPTDGNVYVFASFPQNKVFAFGPDGDYLFQIGTDNPNGGQCGVAVDANGHLRIADVTPSGPKQTGTVTEYAVGGNTASPVGQLAPERRVCRIALNSEGDLFGTGVPQFDYTGVDRYDASGTSEEQIDPGPASAVTVDPETGRILVARATQIREYDDNGIVSSFGVPELGEALGVAVGPGGNAYVTDSVNGNVAIFEPGTTTVPDATVLPPEDVTADSATLKGTVDPLGMPTSYRFEYRRAGAGDPWLRTATEDAGEATGDVPVSAAISDLDFGTDYEVRLIVTDRDRDLSTRSAALTFPTVPVEPRAETVGWPLRSATTVELAARINPHGPGTTYHFEYGPTAVYGSATAEKPAGPAGISRLVLEEIAGLAPGTTLHYRVVATNSGGTTVGGDRAVTSRTSDAPLSHGSLAGPPGSDRAWEQVSIPDANGNSAAAMLGITDSGDRAFYGVQGGTGGSQSGGAFSQFVATRDATGWHSRNIEPPRALSPGNFANFPGTNPELTEIVNLNAVSNGDSALWRMFPDSSGFALVGGPLPSFDAPAIFSEDLSRPVGLSSFAYDPLHPAPEAPLNLYDFSTSPPRLINLMPDGSLALCGSGDSNAYESAGWPLSINGNPTGANRISADGSRVFFPSRGSGECFSDAAQLYMREEDGAGSLADGTTKLISGPPVSGLDFGAAFLAATPNDASDPDPGVIFWTRSRLVNEDNEPTPGLQFDTRDGDLYRYDVNTETNECLTCGAVRADVAMTGGRSIALSYVAVAEEGETIYFTSPHRLVAGEGIRGAQNAYRLDVETGGLTYVATTGNDFIGTFSSGGQAMSPDGSVLVFRSDAASLNQLTDSDNGGFESYYRYDHGDRSLVCVSCPDGRPPSTDSPLDLVTAHQNLANGRRPTPLSDDGDFFFVSDEPLQPEDQNTAGPEEDSGVGADIYEWRDGQRLLVTGGIESSSPKQEPGLGAVSASGRDVFFAATARLTPDAVDGFRRTYDARIGGGFAFPPPPPPCSLEVCQGDAKGPPTDVLPGSSAFSGPGNERGGGKKKVRKCPKGKRRQAGRCVKKPRRGGKSQKRSVR